MEIAQLRQQNKDELEQSLKERQARLAELNFDLAGGKVKNLKEIRQIKIDVARIKTIQREIEK
jgi:ribosomal protein L29